MSLLPGNIFMMTRGAKNFNLTPCASEHMGVHLLTNFKRQLHEWKWTTLLQAPICVKKRQSSTGISWVMRLEFLREKLVRE